MDFYESAGKLEKPFHRRVRMPRGAVVLGAVVVAAFLLPSGAPAGASAVPAARRRPGPRSVELSAEKIRAQFHLSQPDAARALGISVRRVPLLQTRCNATPLRCRAHGCAASLSVR